MPDTETAQRGSMAALVALSLASFIVPCDYLGIALAIPRLRVALGVSPGLLPWLLSGYVLSFGGCLVLGGRLGDWYGRRRMLLLGLTIFGICSAVTAVVSSPVPFIAARVVKGLGSALLSSNAMAAMNVLFPEGQARNRAYGISCWLGAIFSIAYLGVAGALLTLSWRYLLWMNIPLILLFFVAVRRLVPETRGLAPSRRFDFGGALLSVLSFGALSLAVATSFARGPLAATPIMLGLAAVALFATLIRVESRHPNPVMPPRLFKIRSIVGAYVACLFWSAGNTSYPMPLFLQDVLHYTPREASLALMPTTFLGSFVALLLAPVLRSISLRQLLITTLLVESAGITVYATFTAQSSYFAVILPAALVTGAGFLATFVAVRLIAVSGVPASDQGVASGTIFACQQLGNSIGIPAISALLTAVTLSHAGSPDARLAGFHAVFIMCLVLIAVALAAAIWVVRDGPAHTQSRASVGPRGFEQQA